MSETRSRMSSGPSRFMGGALIAANRTPPSLVTLSFSKTKETFWLLSSIGFTIDCSPCQAAAFTASATTTWPGPGYGSGTAETPVWSAHSAVGKRSSWSILLVDLASASTACRLRILRRWVVPNIRRQLILERCIHGVAEKFHRRKRSHGNSALHDQSLLVIHDDLEAFDLVAIHGPDPPQEGGALINL